jgi:hypothetical protein
MVLDDTVPSMPEHLDQRVLCGGRFQISNNSKSLEGRQPSAQAVARFRELD